MKVYLCIECDAEWYDGTPDPAHDDPLFDRIQQAVRDAINNAVEVAEQNGFTHDMDAIISIAVRSIEPSYEVIGNRAADLGRLIMQLRQLSANNHADSSGRDYRLGKAHGYESAADMIEEFLVANPPMEDT